MKTYDTKYYIQYIKYDDHFVLTNLNLKSISDILGMTYKEIEHIYNELSREDGPGVCHVTIDTVGMNLTEGDYPESSIEYKRQLIMLTRNRVDGVHFYG